MAEAQESLVDTAPISPIRERTNTLEHALAKRPEPKELLERGILHAPPGVPAAVQQKQHELEKSMTRDALKNHLGKRPVKEELVQRNILSSSSVAPAIQAHQKELERSMLEDSLDKKLAHRPKPSEVIEKGILNPDEDPTKA
ncbi:RPEL repeat protein [Kalaharituber pfeilii]|nr:RPEL repeat protein [Kalaharituber pfeilii]